MTRPPALALAVLIGAVGLLAGRPAQAEPLHWVTPTADCYDTGVRQKQAIVVIFYDKVTGRLDADNFSMRLGLSPRMQALSNATVWCMADVANDLVAKNIARALGVTEYPTLSVLAPNAGMMNEATRVVGFKGAFAQSGFEGAQDTIARGVAKVRASGTPARP